MKSQRLTVRGQLLSVNQRQHHMPRAAAVKQWRSDAAWEAKAARLTHWDRVSIVATPYQSRSVLADAGNHYWSVKSVVDGLVDAGVLDDDGPKHVASLTMVAPERTTGKVDYLVLELVEASACCF